MAYLDWSKFVKIVGAIAFVAAGFLTYGDGILFEQLYIALLVFMGVIFIRDINVLSVIVITTLANLSSKFLYPLILESEFQSILKILVYAFSILCLYKLNAEAHRKSIMLAIGVCIAAEIYWVGIAYKAPNIYWYVLLITINLLVRYFLFQRVFIMSKYFPKRYRSLDLDISLHELGWYYILIHVVVLFEYLLRHILGMQLTTAYDVAPYVFHAITTYSVLLIFSQGYKIIRFEWFKA